jgi:hypothetical protein
VNKYLLPILALLLVVAVPRLSAAGSSTGISQYTQRVIERARDAENASGGSGGSSEIVRLIQYGESLIFGARDEKMVLPLEADNLPRVTACLRTDIAIIEAEMETVRAKTSEAQKSGNAGDIQRFGSIYQFLADRLDALKRGALSPGYQDATWSDPQSFDSSDTADKVAKETLCPFNTKYFDASVDLSYGCTPGMMDEALQNVPDGSDALKQSIQKEKDALTGLIDKLKNMTTNQNFGTENSSQQVEGCVTEWPGNFRTWSGGRFWSIPGERFLTLMDEIWNIERMRQSSYT